MTCSCKTFSGISKLIMTGLVILLVGLRINHAFRKFQPVIVKDFSFQKLLHPDQDELKRAAQTKTINQLIPEFRTLVEVNSGALTPTVSTLEPYSRYYQKIVTYYPSLSEAYGFLGFCDHFQGKGEEAISAFQKAAKLTPYFFYPHYNLGLLYLARGQYAQATNAFVRALSCRQEIALRIIFGSKLYQQLGVGDPEFNATAARNLEAAYADAAKVLFFIQEATKSPQGKENLARILPLLKIRIF